MPTSTVLLTVAQLPLSVGDNLSPAFTFPTGFDEVDAAFTMNQADLADPTKTMVFQLLCDKGNGFEVFGGFTWTGGTQIGKPPAFKPPHWGAAGQSYLDLAGSTCKVNININAPMSIGVTVTGVNNSA